MHVSSIPTTKAIVRRPRIGMIVGDDKTLHCGVKDYSHVLAQALGRIGFDVDVVAPKSWATHLIKEFLLQLRGRQYDIIHVQYPSIGFRISLIPHALGILLPSSKTAVTLHEFSALPWAQQLSTHLFRWTADAVLFGSRYEQSQFCRRLGRIGAMQQVFPILSQVQGIPRSGCRGTTVVYFGQIRPKKGLEHLLALARCSHERGRPFSFHIMGSVSTVHRSYAEILRAEAAPNVRWSCDLSFQEVAEHLSSAFAAYLPFPDGASERRGSLVAALLNGLPVLSRLGPATTPEIRSSIVVVDSVDEALAALEHLEQCPEMWESISLAAREYALRHTWEDVANGHAEVYRALLANASHRNMQPGS